LLSLLLFTGIFVGSITSRVNQGTNIPVRAACRAIGASASLSSATRNLNGDHKDLSASATPVSFALVTLLIGLAAPYCARSSRPRTTIRRSALPALWLPPLLFRPPPVSTVV
jgi:hypothetical protein